MAHWGDGHNEWYWGFRVRMQDCWDPKNPYGPPLPGATDRWVAIAKNRQITLQCAADNVKMALFNLRLKMNITLALNRSEYETVEDAKRREKLPHCPHCRRLLTQDHMLVLMAKIPRRILALAGRTAEGSVAIH